MSFHNSCQNIHLIHENGSTLLHVEARRRNGEVVARTIRLDRHIGNTDGMSPLAPQTMDNHTTNTHSSPLTGWFIWGGSNFTESSNDIQLEHTERGPKLTAYLRKNDGGYRELQGIYLADKIANEDGHLVFLVSYPFCLLSSLGWGCVNVVGVGTLSLIKSHRWEELIDRWSMSCYLDKFVNCYWCLHSE